MLNLIILSVLKASYYQEQGWTLQNPLDITAAFIVSCSFFWFIKREQKDKTVENKNAQEYLLTNTVQESSSLNRSTDNLRGESQMTGMTHSSKHGFKIEETDLEKETKSCPACGQTIKVLAKKCRFCGTSFDEKQVKKDLIIKRIELIERKTGFSLHDEKKRCPACAEFINIKSMDCEFCNESFCPIEVEKQVVNLIMLKQSALGGCPICGCVLQQAYIEDGGMGAWCPHCRISLNRLRGEI